MKIKIYLPVASITVIILSVLLRKNIYISGFSVFPAFCMPLCIFISLLYYFHPEHERLDFHMDTFGMSDKENKEIDIYTSKSVAVTIPIYLIFVLFGNNVIKVIGSLILILVGVLCGRILYERKRKREYKKENGK